MVRQAKHWCFTLNNYTDEELAQIKLQALEMQYCIIGRETGKEGTPHLQGFLSLERKASAFRVKSKIGTRCHLEIAKAPRAARDYCKKEGNFEEFGEFIAGKGRGRRTDLESVKQDIDAGATLADIQEAHFGTWCRYSKSISEYCRLHSEPRNWETEVHVYWGKTGTGKTRSVHDMAREEREGLYTHTGESWFDGYRGEAWVIFDDFNGSEFKLSYLLKLLDRYPMIVPIKGGFVNWVPRKVFITSNKNPREEWYPNAHPEHREALMRRITEIKHFDSL
jgi:hypothetical protein